MKKKQGSTDDELEDHPNSSSNLDRPRSILKSRKSEESLSPLSDPSEVVISAVVTRRAPASAAVSNTSHHCGGGVVVRQVSCLENETTTSAGDQCFGSDRPKPILKRKDSREDIPAARRSTSEKTSPGLEE